MESSYFHIFPKCISAVWNVVSARIWSWVAVSISSNDDRYTKSASICMYDRILFYSGGPRTNQYSYVTVTKNDVGMYVCMYVKLPIQNDLHMFI